MKSHAKRAIKHLEALGFSQDQTASNPRKGKFVYRHPNEPDRPVKVFAGETDTTSISVMRLGDQIAGTGSQGPRMPSTIKERARVRRETERAQRDQQQRARHARAEEAARAQDARDAALALERHRDEVSALMQPGYGR